MSVGLVIARLLDLEDATAVDSVLKGAVQQVPPGRMLVAAFPLPRSWSASIPFEEIVSRRVLPEPANRSETDDFLFFGNVAVRVCSVPADSGRLTEQEIGLVMFRRAGEKVYVRAKTMADSDKQAARIPTLHPVFTRDVANNVWHLDRSRWEEAMLSRLASLLCWPDEDVVVASESGSVNWGGLRNQYDQDLVGVPTKVAYDWFPTQMPLPVP